MAWFLQEVLDGSLSNLWVTAPNRRYSARFWTDNWTPYGSLRLYLTSPGSSSLGIPAQATVASLFRNNTWMIPPWYRSVWNKSGIPRHNFLAWLFVLNRCPTKDHILGWGLQADPSCVLCNSAAESRNHLFFDFSFAWHLWESCSVRCGIIPQRRWERVMDQLQLLSLNSTKSTLLRICWQGCMYWTWTERNARIHRQIFRSPDSIFRLLGRQIRNRILSLRDSSPTLSSSLMQTCLV